MLNTIILVTLSALLHHGVMKDGDDDCIAFTVCVIKCTAALTLFVQFLDNTDLG